MCTLVQICEYETRPPYNTTFQVRVENFVLSMLPEVMIEDCEAMGDIPLNRWFPLQEGRHATRMGSSRHPQRHTHPSLPLTPALGGTLTL